MAEICRIFLNRGRYQLGFHPFDTTKTSLRGVARIRQAALAAILGEATRADSFADGDMAGAENAWDASGGHVHGGALPQF